MRISYANRSGTNKTTPFARTPNNYRTDHDRRGGTAASRTGQSLLLVEMYHQNYPSASKGVATYARKWCSCSQPFLWLADCKYMQGIGLVSSTGMGSVVHWHNLITSTLSII